MQEPIDDVRELIARHCVTRREQTPIRGLLLLRDEEPSAPANTMYRPTLCVVAQGRKQVVLGERIFQYDSSTYLIATVDLPVRGCILEASADRPYLGLTLDLSAARIADLVLDLPPASPAHESRAGLVANGMGNELLDPLARLLKLLDRPQDAAVLAPLIEREIYYRLLQGEQCDVLRQLATADSHLSHIRKATDWLRSHYAESISVEALAEMAGMSVTSFHRHFKAITMMSPLQYRTRIRLQEARRLMLTDGLDALSIGLDVGYESASQFSREYRKMFGMPPAADAARLRQAVAIRA